jgi:hypothetical protein
MTKQELFQMFLGDHRRYAEPALHYSFRKYATRRDELISKYSVATGIPSEDFHDALACETAKDLI